MDVNVFGTTNKKLISLLEEATGYYAHQLMRPRTVRRLKIDIEILPYRKMPEQGAVLNEDSEKRYPSNFVVELRREHASDPDRTDIFKVLAHEMVHVKQYALNELANTWKTCSDTGSIKPEFMWRNSEWKADPHHHAYFDLPWEDEAYSLEETLYAGWLAHKNLLP